MKNSSSSSSLQTQPQNEIKISRVSSLFKTLLDKNYKEKAQNQRRLISAIDKTSYAEIKGLLDDKKASPNTPVWFSQVSLDHYDDVHTHHCFLSPLQYVLKEFREDPEKALNILTIFFDHGAKVSEKDLTVYFFGLFVGKKKKEGDTFSWEPSVQKIIKLLSQQGLDWSKCFVTSSEYETKHLAKHIVDFWGEENAQALGVGLDKNGAPINCFVSPQSSTKENFNVSCLSIKTNFAPKAFTEVLKSLLGITEGQAQQKAIDFAEGQELIIPCHNEEQSLKVSQIMDELGVFTSSPCLRSQAMINVSKVLMINRTEQQEPLSQKTHPPLHTGGNP